MMDRERALKIMGLKEGAADREIEHRYFILMKKQDGQCGGDRTGCAFHG